MSVPNLANFILALAYFFIVVGLSIAHIHSAPSVWLRSLYELPWPAADKVSEYPPRLPPINYHGSTRLSFSPNQYPPSATPDISRSSGHTSITIGKSTDPMHSLGDMPTESLFKKQLSLTPPLPDDTNHPGKPWWTNVSVRPGIDVPFAAQPNGGPAIEDPVIYSASGFQGKTEHDIVDELWSDARPYIQQGSRYVPESATDRIIDEDRPLPRPPRSEWVRANGVVNPLRIKRPK